MRQQRIESFAVTLREHPFSLWKRNAESGHQAVRAHQSVILVIKDVVFLEETLVDICLLERLIIEVIYASKRLALSQRVDLFSEWTDIAIFLDVFAHKIIIQAIRKRYFMVRCASWEVRESRGTRIQQLCGVLKNRRQRVITVRTCI